LNGDATSRVTRAVSPPLDPALVKRLGRSRKTGLWDSQGPQNPVVICDCLAAGFSTLARQTGLNGTGLIDDFWLYLGKEPTGTQPATQLADDEAEVQEAEYREEDAAAGGLAASAPAAAAAPPAVSRPTNPVIVEVRVCIDGEPGSPLVNTLRNSVYQALDAGGIGRSGRWGQREGLNIPAVDAASAVAGAMGSLAAWYRGQPTPAEAWLDHMWIYAGKVV
jgi:hypothetical protein